MGSLASNTPNYPSGFLGRYHVWLQIAVPTPLLDVTSLKLLKLRQCCAIREVEMECCTFLFIYLLVHTSIQQVRRENANDAGTARRRGAGGQGREPRRNALASDRLDRRCWCLRLSCPSSGRSPSWWTCSPLAFAPPVPRSVCLGAKCPETLGSEGGGIGPI